MKAPQLETILSRQDIKKIVQALATRISKDYKDQEVVLIGVLKGGVVFLADLIRELTNPVQIDFIQVASYGSEITSTGQVEMKKRLKWTSRIGTFFWSKILWVLARQLHIYWSI